MIYIRTKVVTCSDNLCLNGATCLNKATSDPLYRFVCQCKAGFSGEYCQTNQTGIFIYSFAINQQLDYLIYFLLSNDGLFITPMQKRRHLYASWFQIRLCLQTWLLRNWLFTTIYVTRTIWVAYKCKKFYLILQWVYIKFINKLVLQLFFLFFL